MLRKWKRAEWMTKWRTILMRKDKESRKCYYLKNRKVAGKNLEGMKLLESMKSWRVELTSGEENLGEVNIRRGIF